jgi:hypothetical protein
LFAVAVLAVLLFATLFLGFVGTQRVQAQEFTGVLTSSTITVGTASIGISGTDSLPGDTTTNAVAIIVVQLGNCPSDPLGQNIVGPYVVSLIAGSPMTYSYSSIDTSTLSVGSYCVRAGSSSGGPNSAVDLPLTVIPAAPAPTAVGGVVMPANNPAIVAPWLAIIGLVGCISTVVVVAKKRRS